MTVRPVIWIFAVLACSCSVLWGQGQRYVFEQVSDLEVMPEIYSLDLDEYDRLWYSTWGRGAFCYDGYGHQRFITDSDNPNSIINDRIYDLLLDKKQRVWVSTLSGLCCLDRKTGQVRRFKPFADTIFQYAAMMEDKQGNIWLAGPHTLFRFDEIQQEIVEIPHASAYRPSGTRARQFYEDRNGDLWLCRGQELLRFSTDRTTYQPVSLQSESSDAPGIIYSILEQSNGAFLLGAQNGLFYLDRSSWGLRRVPLPDSMPYRRINCLIETPGGVIWAGSQSDGLWRWDTRSGALQQYINNPMDPGSLPNNTVFSLAYDRFGNLWAGGGHKLVRINILPQAFALWPVDQQIPQNRINSIVRIAEDTRGGLVVRTVNDLVYFSALGAPPERLNAGVKKKIVPDDLFVGKDGTIWAADGGKILRWDVATRRFNAVKTPFVQGDIHNLIEDAENPYLFWLGTGNGLKSWDRRSGQVRDFPNLSPPRFDRYVRNLADDGHGALWLDLPHFLGKFDKKTGSVQLFNTDSPAPHHLVNNEILDINPAPDGWVWVNTSGGVTRIDPATGHFHNLTRADGLADNVVSTVLFDRNGDAWLVTPEHIQRYETQTGRLQTYNTAAQFQTATWTRGRCERGDGTLVFAGMRGLLTLDPGKLEEARPPSAILLTRFDVSDQEAIRHIQTEQLQHIQLSHTENNITIEWAAIQTARSGELQYEYKLVPKGEKRDWIYKGRERQAVFANLDPGAYTFYARLAGVEKPELVVQIAIAPAWYQAESFKMLLMALGVTIAYLFWRNREDRRELMQQKELAEQNARYKTRFLANMSHEIRTPMNAIVGLSRLLSESKLPPKQADYADAIRQSSENLLVIVNDVLDQAKIESGKFAFQHKPFDLEVIMRHLENTLGFKAEEKGLQYSVDIAPGVPVKLIGDSVRLNQILTNLLGNAIKFTENGKVGISVTTLAETSAQTGDKTVLHFKVYDTGIGIPADQVERVFESFQQADDDISAQYGGTGLGLSITKDLVEQQGGRIRLESVEGAGTSVEVSLPFEPDNSGRNTTAEQPAAGVSFGPLHILLVEDTFFNQMLAVELLKSRIPGVVIELAENGSVALEKLENSTQPFDLVFMDVKMPVMDGLEATRRIRQMPAFVRLPIIALTANAVQEELEKCHAAGMNAWVTKPIDADELFNTMQNVLHPAS